jgi:hypothetical protein
MKTRTSTKVAVSAAIVMSWTWLTALQCGDTGPTNPTFQGCPVTSYDSDFPNGTVTMNKPANCPIKTTGFATVPYAATADLPAGSVSWQFYQWDQVSWNGYHGGFFGNAAWAQGGGRYFVTITGDYRPAGGGFDANDAGWDDIRHGFYSSYTGWWTYATTRITYQWGIPSNNITAPGTVGLSEAYGVSATTNDPMLVSPVTWRWYVDGQLAATTSVPAASLYSGNQSTMQGVEVVATDGNGHSVSGYKTVIVGDGCNPNDPCGPVAGRSP